MENIKINILGTEYEVVMTTDKEDIDLKDANGICDCFAKTIKLETEFNEKDPTSIQDIDKFKNKVFRHEIIHALFHESGLSDYGSNEQLVDWIAIQSPKLNKLFSELDIIE